MNEGPSVWTDERVTLLKRLWTEGLSASQIAGRLGNGVTRNAVIGKISRLNLAQRARPSTPRKSPIERAKRVRPTVSVTPRAPQVKAQPIEPQPRPVPQPEPLKLSEDGRVTILHLSDKTCKWPIGDPGAEDFCFCGHKPREGSPYCEYHARLAYQPVVPSRRTGHHKEFVPAEDMHLSNRRRA